MTNPDQPSAPPTLTLVEKLYAVQNINTLVLEKLDLARIKTYVWRQDDVVTYAINGLSDKLKPCSIIVTRYRSRPLHRAFKWFSLLPKEMRIRNKSPSLSVSTNSSASSSSVKPETPIVVQTPAPTRNCTYMIRLVCRGLDLAAQQQLLSLLQAQNTLLAQYGLSTISIPRTPIGFNNSGNHRAIQVKKRFVPTAFNTMTLQDPANANWHMDTGASSHLNSSAHNLRFLDSSNSPRCDSTVVYLLPGSRLYPTLKIFWNGVSKRATNDW
ncbi:hypothetical protein Tco_1066271 [Tanacetum coccineum]|uniref:Uncharacterized protein n=1 Tax=Tanacetum coccineum TaxID=301880 RepID=A0ABQ5HAS1_9ASTR